jgi:hypothetical protein
MRWFLSVLCNNIQKNDSSACCYYFRLQYTHVLSNQWPHSVSKLFLEKPKRGQEIIPLSYSVHCPPYPYSYLVCFLTFVTGPFQCQRDLSFFFFFAFNWFAQFCRRTNGNSCLFVPFVVLSEPELSTGGFLCLLPALCWFLPCFFFAMKIFFFFFFFNTPFICNLYRYNKQMA